MTNLQLLPKWIMKRYLILWKDLNTKEFEFNQALTILQKMPKPDDRRVVGLFLSELRKAGWLEVNFDPADTRKRIYRLKEYRELFDKIVSASLRPDKETGDSSERR